MGARARRLRRRSDALGREDPRGDPGTLDRRIGFRRRGLTDRPARARQRLRRAHEKRLVSVCSRAVCVFGEPAHDGRAGAPATT
ncbi:hypothetical protein F01_230085 [Burkholderia cenocepacia]|nr:hypothetical protein F01_230085 [Burkholderia cenocepacia]